MTIRFEKIHPAAVLPFYAHPGDAGMDLTSVEAASIAPGESRLIHTGLRMALPENAHASKLCPPMASTSRARYPLGTRSQSAALSKEVYHVKQHYRRGKDEA